MGKSKLASQIEEAAGDMSATIVAAISGALFLISAYSLYMDIMASYYGWGTRVASLIKLPGLETHLAWLMTLTLSGVQLIGFSIKIAGMEKINIKAVDVALVCAAILDNFLDAAQMYTSGIASAMVALLISFVFFTLISEFLFPFCGSIVIGYLKTSSSGILDQKNVGGGRGRGV